MTIIIIYISLSISYIYIDKYIEGIREGNMPLLTVGKRVGKGHHKKGEEGHCGKRGKRGVDKRKDRVSTKIDKSHRMEYAIVDSGKMSGVPTPN